MITEFLAPLFLHLEVLLRDVHPAVWRRMTLSDALSIAENIAPEAEHVLDRFHVTMRLTVLGQMIKGAWADPPMVETRRPRWTKHPRPRR